MRKCYHCKISFVHAGDPIDGNDFCGHACSGSYIELTSMGYHSLAEWQGEKVDEIEKQTKEEVQTKVD